MQRPPLSAEELASLRARIAAFAAGLGFEQLGVADTGLEADARRLQAWLDAGMHGAMDFMQRHGRKRTHPAELVPGTLRVLSLRMNCTAPDGAAAGTVLADGSRAYIARYALGRDYHHIVRPRLQKLALRIAADIGPFGYRAFVDSAPVLEKPLARNAGLGWIGKHTNLINAAAGSLFVLGELFTDLPLPPDAPAADHCGSCTACLPACPTGAIVAPYLLDARRCISYLTIEYHGSIPLEFRAPIGNRVFGCDDCQLVCPWNKFAPRRGTGLPHASRARRSVRGRPVRLDRRGVPAPHGGQRAQASRLLALAAQSRDRARQRAALARRDRGARRAPRLRPRDRAGTRALGTGPPARRVLNRGAPGGPAVSASRRDGPAGCR